MDGEMLKENLKAIYKDAKAPEGFSLCVMQRIKVQAQSSPSKDVSFSLRRALRPAIAVAACFVLALGMYIAAGGLPGVSPVEDLRTAEAPAEDEPKRDVQIVEEVPYINGDGPALMAEAKEVPVDLPPVIVEPPLDNASIAQNGQNNDLPADNVPLLTVSAVNGDSALRRSEPAVANGHSHAVTSDKPVEIVPLTEIQSSFVLSEADIPDTSLFVPRRRVINSVSVNISVGTINKAKLMLEQRERLFGISADVESAEIRSDGTIVTMRSYLVPNSQVNSFVTHVSSVGSAVQIKRDSMDITQDFQRMLGLHRESIINMTATGQGISSVNEIVADLMFLDKRSHEGVQNVVVWLEDAVDF